MTSQGNAAPPHKGLQAMARLHAGLRMERRARVLASHLAELVPTGASVLDVGAGNGRVARALLERRPDLTIRAIDTKLWPDRTFDVEPFDGVSIPFAERSFDVCLVSDVLHHCADAPALLREMARVSAGLVVIKDHVANSTFDSKVLRLMDWFGNRGHEVPLLYDYWPWQRWEAAFKEIDCVVQTLRKDLNLYSMPLTLLFDRNLHFIAVLAKHDGVESTG